MQTLGDYLRKGREARNISLADISDYTKISKIYLDCLEKDDFKNMPAELYVKGYISSYASCVGIDEHEALKLYDSFQIETNDAQNIQSAMLQEKKDSTPLFHRLGKNFWFASAICILFILAAGSYYSFFKSNDKVAVNNSLEEQNKTAPPAPTSTPEPDLLQKTKTENSIQPIVHDGFEKKSESHKIGTEPVDGITQIPDPLPAHQPQQESTMPIHQSEPNTPLPIHRPEQSLKETVPDQTLPENSSVKDVSGAANDQTHFENNIKIIETGAYSSIENRVPREYGESFQWSMEKVFIWTRIECKKPPSSIRHVYYFKGEKVNDILLNVRSSHWRTWSYKTLSNKRYIGPWRVVEIPSAALTATALASSATAWALLSS